MHKEKMTVSVVVMCGKIDKYILKHISNRNASK